MASSDIVTGQYVQIQQTPASVGERIGAQLIDWLIQGIFAFTLLYLIDEIGDYVGFIGNNSRPLLFISVLIIILYCPLCEIFNHGQTIGKKILKMRVVKKDGSTPSVGAYLMRWLLMLVDGPTLSGLGILVMLLNQDNQRIGDIAAGTMVIKLNSYHQIQVSLDEFNHLSKNYRPVYPQVTDLSLEQINLITRTLELPDDDPRIHALAEKAKQILHISTPHERSDDTFLWRLVKDYQYYALEEI
ncbi:MAG: RDD family protein [Prevotella sp.]|nr:RDD family protein [Prevotella sp.]MBR5929552.1 RDD family protein [Prevotella sp.]